MLKGGELWETPIRPMACCVSLEMHHAYWHADKGSLQRHAEFSVITIGTKASLKCCLYVYTPIEQPAGSCAAATEPNELCCARNAEHNRALELLQAIA
jgi:hypothetical protein